MKSNLESFSWIGKTFAVLKRGGKVPVVKERLNKSASCSEQSFLKLLPTIFYKIFVSHQMIALQKL